MKKKYLTFFLLFGAFIGLGSLSNLTAQADILTAQTDNTGNVTGEKGANYYNVNNWQDMFDTYNDIAPKASSSNPVNVYFNVTGTISGSSAFATGAAILPYASVTILGNGNTIYVDDDNDPSSNPAHSSAYAASRWNWGFYANGGSNKGGGNSITTAQSGAIGNDTVLTVKNAKIINSSSNGIFRAFSDTEDSKGNGPKPTFIYQDVNVSNGGNRGAAPIRNDLGKIIFKGKNTFNILNDQSMTTTASKGTDDHGQWCVGNTWIEIADGTTTLNQNWAMDEQFYNYNSNSSTLKIADNANLIMNINTTFDVYYDTNNTGPLNWIVGNNANFIYNGTTNTASKSGQWFNATAFTSWDLNIGENSNVAFRIGGGVINFGGLDTALVNWKIGKGSNFVMSNLNKTGNMFSGKPKVGSGIELDSVGSFSLNNANSRSPIIPPGQDNFPIHIVGDGLRTHASDLNWSYEPADSPDIANTPNAALADVNAWKWKTPNEQDIDEAGDIWYRQNTGEITGFGTRWEANMSPNQYSDEDLKAFRNARFFSLYSPSGIWSSAAQSNMAKTFDLSLDSTASNGLPIDGSWSDLMDGQTGQKLILGDDRGQNPNYHVTVTQMENRFAHGLQFFWTHPTSGQQTQLKNETAALVASVTSDDNLPAWISSANAGAKYTLDFEKHQGLRVKGNNRLLAANHVDVATFKYTIADGPA